MSRRCACVQFQGSSDVDRRGLGCREQVPRVLRKGATEVDNRCFESNRDTFGGSEAGSYLRLIDFLYQSTLGLRVIKKKRKKSVGIAPRRASMVAVASR